MKFWVQYHDAAPDHLGRRRFTMYWLREGGLPGTPSTFHVRGTRRAQEFFAVPGNIPGCLEGEAVAQAPWEASK